jgi:L-threonylcarbamoyladenylate synthase
MKTQILAPTSENILQAGELLRQSHVIGMPTETVYGLAGNAFNEEAVTKIFSAKERPTFDPLIVHVSDSIMNAPSLLEALQTLGLVSRSSLSERAQQRAEILLRAFWPGPFTLVLPKTTAVPDLVTSGLETVAIRMPRHPIAQALLRAAGTPLAAPSANRFGRISPTCAKDVLQELDERIPVILDGGSCEVGLESTVLAINAEGDTLLLRPGGITAKEIQTALEDSDAAKQIHSQNTGKTSGFQSPGQLPSHYAPRKRLLMLPCEEWNKLPASGGTLGLLVITGNAEEKAATLNKLTGRTVIARSLSTTGDWHEAARNLFSTLRALDDSEAAELICEPCLHNEGLAFAIADRLKRASSATT